MNCKKCKQEIPGDSLYCMWCGAPVKKNPKKKMYQRPDGLFEKIIVVDGKRIAFRGKTEAEVNKKMVEFHERKELGRKFDEVAEEWEKEHFPTLAYNTIRGYKPALDRALERFGGDYIKKITPTDINSFIVQFSRQGWALKTVQTQILVLNLIFSKAVVDGDVETNPVEYVRPPKNLSKKARGLPSQEQIEIIKDSVSHEFGLFPFFLLYTGCRLGEALGVQFKDIDRESKMITISKSVYHVGNIPQIKEPKTEAGIRKVILLEKLLAVLPSWRKSEEDHYLFSGTDTPLTASQVRLAWNKYCRENGLAERKEDKSGKAYYVPYVTPHQLRHSYATILFEAGVPEKDAQELLGHANISITRDIYTHIRTTRKEKTAELLNQFTD